MTWVDYAIIGIIALSALIGLLRGFVREALSLTAWVVAIWVAVEFSGRLAPVLTQYIPVPSLRLIAAFAALFLGILILIGIINFLIVRLLAKTGLGGTDQMLGVVFGIARGVVVIAILVLLAGATPFPKDPWWRQSMLIFYFEDLAMVARNLLPADIASHFAYQDS
ncbi:MAG: CvpA family protein [Gammaproteobacteria bacterium]|nr:CvpA family protein [Gammaproteobacteria bacterium]